MLSLKLLTIFAIIHVSSCSGNVFLDRLNILLEHCLSHQDFDSGAILGIFFAKSLLKRFEHFPGIDKLLEKCAELENRFLSDQESYFKAHDIGKLRLMFKIMKLENFKICFMFLRSSEYYEVY